MPSLFERRWKALSLAGFNAALVAAADVPLDLSTDVAPAVRPRVESPRAVAHEGLGAAVSSVLGCRHWLPVHLGRGAESVIAAQVQPGQTVLCNEVYVTGTWSIERNGGHLQPLPAAVGGLGGDLDVSALAAALATSDVALVWLTAPRALLTSAGGRPVSLGNLTAVRKALDRAAPGVPLVLDGSRLVENAVWIRRLEPAHQGRAIADLLRDQAACADILFLSGRKDLGARHGGILVAHDSGLMAPLAATAQLLEGRSDSGGLSAIELADLAAGLRAVQDGGETERGVEALDELARQLVEEGVPVASWGSGALYLDAARWLPGVPRDRCPAQTLVNALYLHAGMRTIGTPATNLSGQQLVRLSVRPGTAGYLATVLGELKLILRDWRWGFRRVADRGPFLDELEPAAHDAWRALLPGSKPPARNEIGFGFANPAWPVLEQALRARLELDERARVLPAAPERGPQRLLSEAALRLRPALEVVTGDPLLQRLAAFWRRNTPGQPSGSSQTLHAVTWDELAGVARKRRAGDLIAVDLGPLTSWPESTGPALQRSIDVLWASDPAAPRVGGGFLTFAADGPLYRAVRDTMLFAVGSIHDGGMSQSSMIELAAAVSAATPRRRS